VESRPLLIAGRSCAQKLGAVAPPSCMIRTPQLLLLFAWIFTVIDLSRDDVICDTSLLNIVLSNPTSSYAQNGW
jgi:hypothetical protein